MSSTTPQIERRFSAGSVSLTPAQGGTSAAGSGRTITGTCVQYGKRSEMLYDDHGAPFYEVVMKGAFDRVLDGDIVALLNHDDRYVLARSRGGKGTLRVWTDEVGLHYQFAADPEQSYARDLMIALRRHDINESSFAFRLGKGDDSWTTEKGVRLRTIKQVAGLYDVSLVTRAAYGANTSAGVRNIDTAAPTPDLAQERWATVFGRGATPAPARRTEAPSYIYKPPRDANGHRIDPSYR